MKKDSSISASPIGLVAKRAALLVRPRVVNRPAGSLVLSLDNALRLEVENRLRHLLGEMIAARSLCVMHPESGDSYSEANSDHDAYWPLWCVAPGIDLKKLAANVAARYAADGTVALAADDADLFRSTAREVNYRLLATKEQLLSAFGELGLKGSWFRHLSGHEWLLRARIVAGVSYRAGVKPLFCPFRTMQGLCRHSTLRTTATEAKGLEILRRKFPDAYVAHVTQGSPANSAAESAAPTAAILP